MLRIFGGISVCDGTGRSVSTLADRGGHRWNRSCPSRQSCLSIPVSWSVRGDVLRLERVRPKHSLETGHSHVA